MNHETHARVASPRALARSLLLAAVFTAGATGCDALRSPEARIERARAAAEAGDYREASVQLKSLLESKPEHAEARLALAEVSLDLGDAESADKELRRAVAAGLPAERAGALQGRIMLALGQATELLRLINDGSLLAPEPDRSILKGDALVAAREWAAGEAQYREVLGQRPDEPRAVVGLAAAMAAQGRRDEALDALDQLLGAQPGAAAAWLLRGEILARAARFSEAEESFRKAVTPPAHGLGLPQQVAALTGLAESQLALGTNDAAKATLGQLNTLAPGSAQARVIAARVALVEQDYATAVTQLQPLAAAAPDLVVARLLLGVALLAQGSLEQAEGHLSQVVRLAPDNIEARKVLAKVRLRLQRYDSAMQVLSPAMQSDTLDPELASLLSEAKLQAGASAEAVALLEQSAQRNPKDAAVKLDLAAAYIATGRSAEAVELLRALPEVTGDLRRETLLIAALAAAKGPVEARREVEQLVARNPKDVQILSLAAAYAESQGDHAGARGYLQRGLALAPADPRLLTLLAQVETRAGSLDAAEAALQRLLEVPSARTAARVGLAEVALMRGRTDEARKGLEQIRAEDAQAIPPRLMLAQLMLAASEAEPAAKVLAEAIAIAPRDASLRLQVARLLAEAGRYDEALRQAREATDIAPQSADAWTEVARLQLALDRAGPAREAAEKAATADRDSVEAASLLALLDLREKRGEAALQRAQSLAARRPDDARVAVLEGDVRMALGQPREAAQAYARAFSLRPNLQVAAKQSAALRAAQQPNPEAPLARWVAERPDDLQGRAMLGEAYLLAGRNAPAIEQYERLAASPTAGYAVLNNLAWLYQQTGDDRAEATARRAYDLASGDPAVLDTYGWILVTKGKVAEGLPLLAKAAELAPDNPDIRRHHAEALKKAGQKGSD